MKSSLEERPIVEQKPILVQPARQLRGPKLPALSPLRMALDDLSQEDAAGCLGKSNIIESSGGDRVLKNGGRVLRGDPS